MNEIPPMHDQTAATYLHHLQELTSEISAATEAISANALPELQASVAKQEMLCAHLSSMADTVTQSLRPRGSSRSPIDAEIEAKIHAAAVTLHELNLKYAALLKHSGKTIALLVLLCNSRRFPEDRGANLKHQTWSCEA